MAVRDRPQRAPRQRPPPRRREPGAHPRRPPGTARRRAAERRAPPRAPPGEPERRDAGIDSVEHRDLLAGALASLAPEEREAIALRFGAELTLPEIADVLGEPRTTVEGRVYRALRKLRDRLDGD